MRALSLLTAVSMVVACWLGVRGAASAREAADTIGAARTAGAAGSAAAASAARYLALGDSYTIGETIAAGGRWPVQLAALLRQGGVAVGEPEIVARTGWTTDELASGIDAAAPRGPFALVSLLIGVNDQYRGGRPVDYRAGFAALLRRAIAFASGEPGRVIVLSIPDWSVTPFAAAGGRDLPRIASEIRQFNAINREETVRAGARYVDITPVSQRALGDGALLAADGLHPSAGMYAEWARLALPAATAALAERHQGHHS
jgi:lysophospholipase L1-like esterase